MSCLGQDTQSPKIPRHSQQITPHPPSAQRETMGVTTAHFPRISSLKHCDVPQPSLRKGVALGSPKPSLTHEGTEEGTNSSGPGSRVLPPMGDTETSARSRAAFPGKDMTDILLQSCVEFLVQSGPDTHCPSKANLHQPPSLSQQDLRAPGAMSCLWVWD